MSTSEEHEEALAQSFVVKAKRDRVATLLGNPRRRRTLIRDLPHFDHWDTSVVVPLAASEQTAAGILAALRRMGAVVSQNPARMETIDDPTQAGPPFR